MKNPALSLLEEVFEYGLNPEQDYAAQLEPLGSNGELANAPKKTKLLFSLCQIVDRQNREIQALKDDRAAIAAEMVNLSSLITKPAVDPTKPLDAQATPTTGSNSGQSI